MDESKPRDDAETRETAEPPHGDDLAEEAGVGDEHSEAPGETGTGSREGDPEQGKPYRR